MERDPEVDRHFYKDINVTLERVRLFGRAERGVQLQVLARLRATSADQSTGIEIATVAIVVSFVTFIVKPSEGVDFGGMYWVVATVVAMILGVLAVLAVFPVLIPQLLRNNRQQYAQVWIAAYEDELIRRASRRSKSKK